MTLGGGLEDPEGDALLWGKLRGSLGWRRGRVSTQPGLVRGDEEVSRVEVEKGGAGVEALTGSFSGGGL